MRSKLIVLILILFVGFFLRVFKLDELMGFIGDQGWFYLSARDLALGKEFPLVGVTASYTWLHQGALWTYMLAPILIIFNFNPIGGAYLSVIFGLLSIFLIFKIGKEFFSENAGLIAAFLLATSPLAINDSRFAYHTSPLAFFTLLFFYSLFKYSKSNKKYLILSTFILGILYNLELSTMVFWVILVMVIFLVKKLDIKIIFASIGAFIIPLIPMMVYDFLSGNDYFQSTAFLRFLKLSIEGGGSHFPFRYIYEQIFTYNRDLVFFGNREIALIISISAIPYLFFIIYREFRKKKINYSNLLIYLWVFLSIIGIFAKKDISGAYIPMVYPGVILAVSLLFSKIINKYKDFKYFVIIFILFIGISNSLFIISNSYNLSDQKDVITFKETLEASREIVERANSSKYNLIVRGDGDQFESYDDHFQYLTWYLGNSPSKNNENMKFTIDQKNGNIYFVNEQENSDTQK